MNVARTYDKMRLDIFRTLVIVENTLIQRYGIITSLLKFYPVVVICDRHLVKLSFGHHYRFDELLDSFVELHGGR